MIWKYYNPIFDYEKVFSDNHLPWAGHKTFGYDLIRNYNPKIIVELGTFKGTSFFSFAQALKDKNDSECMLVGIDSWEGDLNTGKYEGDKMFNEVSSIAQKFYENINIKLIRGYFDEQVSKFENNSIDILHIDGLHTYEAVKNDYINWLPKMKENGIILFHDIVVERENFGVKQLWDEISESSKFKVSFHHSYGLGVLFLGDNHPTKFNHLEFHNHYLLKSFEKIKSTLFQSSYLIKELEDIKNSKFWKLKEGVKFILRKK
jgi:predicted O-methyltransferase YrrM